MTVYLDFKSARCKNCYKCLKECPVKAIRIVNNQAKIIETRCILCGKCTLVCPQNAKEVHSELSEIKALVRSKKVIASVAPSFISNFNVPGFSAMRNALKQAGFYDAEETARGARAVADEYERLLAQGKYKNFITSCCPSVNRAISLYYQDALKYLAPVESPAVVHARILKEENPGCSIVFIGPCIAKKKECRESGLFDGVLTFEELAELFEELDIQPEDTKEAENQYWNRARVFPVSTGVIKTLKNPSADYEYIAVDGASRCREVLEEIDRLEGIFVELNTCQGACVNGPCTLNREDSSIISNARVRKYTAENSWGELLPEKDENVSVFCEHSRISTNDRQPSEEEIRKILEETDKYTPEDELDCGACGYSSCREKAWAVANGYADVEMCLPYMRERAENLSGEIIENSPNGIVVIDSNFRVVDINDKASQLLGIEQFREKADSIIDLTGNDPDIIEALAEKRNLKLEELLIPATDSYVEFSLNHMKDHNMIFATMKDITEEVHYNEKLDKLTDETIAAADAVIKKQMRTAQEIASLLGETTAESKIALMKLKEILLIDEEDEQ